MMQTAYYLKDGILVRDSQTADVEYLKDRLRVSDINEIWASHRHTPEEALKISLQKSVICLTVEVNDVPVAMFGICPEQVLDEKATIWFLSSEMIKPIKIRFLRNSKYFVNMLLGYYDTLYNYVDIRNTDSIAWLRFIGAEFESPAPFGPDGLLFRKFTFKGRV